MKYFTATVTLHRPVQGHPEKATECRVDLAIDEEALFIALGNRALRNKSKRTKQMNGLITAEVHVKGGG